MELGPVEARVIGSLAEKQLTTPQQYPLTLNALVLACNQTSNRDPVVAYDESAVEPALSSLKETGLLRFVHPGHGRSATRYRQVLEERFGLDAKSLSLLAVLLLRGPQTAGELRTRTERMADWGGSTLHEVEAELGRLVDRPDPLVRRLARRPGQKEERWAQLLTGEPLDQEQARDVTSDSSAGSTEAPQQPQRRPSAPPGDEVATLRAELETLRAELREISAVVEELRSAFDL